MYIVPGGVQIPEKGERLLRAGREDEQKL